MTQTIPIKLIEDTAREPMARAAIDIPPDYCEGIRQARDLERSKLPRFVLTEMLENWNIARAERRPMCADTGFAALLHSHTGGMPVGIHSFCLSSRRATARIHPDGRVDFRTDPQWFTDYYRRTGIE